MSTKYYMNTVFLDLAYYYFEPKFFHVYSPIPLWCHIADAVLYLVLSKPDKMIVPFKSFYNLGLHVKISD